MKKEVDRKLAFLDVFIDISANYTKTSTFRKKNIYCSVTTNI